MALRAFKSNPSIGGFGGEYASSRLGGDADADALSSSRVKVTVGRSCDAFAQIVKELVDNAVDACAPFEDTTNTIGIEGKNRERAMKRVRVTITSATVPVARDNDNDNGSGVSISESCLRIEVSDNGCGMADIDYCVSAFSSNKNWMASNVESQTTKTATKRKLLLSNVKNANNEKMVKGGYEKKTSTSDGNDNYTSGRYGVGLTLCLLHAQRLVPGTGACVTSATASASEWTRAIYEPDTDADAIMCKKKDKFPKVVGESGTTISLLVPGGEDARTAWPRLAEYFARFQLTTDLPCSLEVKATTLQSMPLYIRPSNEIERRMNRSSVEHSITENEWDGGDGFNDIHSIESAPKISKAAQLRADVDAQKKEKRSLLRKAAAAYKQRHDLKLENVAYSIQPIRRTITGSRQSASSKDGPVLEMSLIVFGPELEDTDNQSDESDSECYPRGRNESKKMNSAELQVVRMVNGIPLLDSSEAMACGIVNKVSSNSDTWNCFGLCVTRKSENDEGTEPLTELNTPTFEVNDSAQVAPFLTTSSHSLFYDQSKDFEHSNSSDDDDFDTENRKWKRKKERQVPCHLPAAVRLGHILMIVQIRAKPSALPLPTLSKGRLPLNDKGINDALENGLADCLRSLQQSNPELLLTAQQLKKVERDMKYVPAVTGAIASVLGRSLRTCSVIDNAMDITSRWDDGEKAMRLKYDMELRTVPIMGRARAGTTIRSNAEDERAKVEALRSALERRLRFIVSDELKDATKNDEKEQQKKAREEFAASRKKIKKLASDDMKGDCFDSKGSDESSLGGSINHLHRNPIIENSAGRQESGGSDGSMTQSVLHSQQAQAALGDDGSCNALSNKGLDANVGSPLLNIGQKCWKKSSVNSDFDDGYESSPTRVSVRKVAETDIQTLQTKIIEESRKSNVERPNKTSFAHDDAMSCSSEWSSQYGEVVAGYFFR